MASPPNYGSRSPPAPGGLPLPRQRPFLVLPTGGPSRRTSIASATSSSHPLRQTSFPPADRSGSPGGGDSNAVYSPVDSLDGDSDILSAVGPAGGSTTTGTSQPLKRKRGERRPPGRPSKKQGSQVNGTDDGKSKTGAKESSAAPGEGEDSDAEEDDGALAGDQSQVAAWKEFENARNDLVTQLQHPNTQSDRLGAFLNTKLKPADVKRLVNSVTSQSVPSNAILMVTAYTKLFVGQLIEEAREVQSEWMSVAEQRADGENNPIAKKLRVADEPGFEADTQSSRQLASDDNHPDETANSAKTWPAQSLGLRAAIAECDRGPLLPAHLREALRRYKKSRGGGTVGFTGLSLEGRTNTAARMGGRRMFR